MPEPNWYNWQGEPRIYRAEQAQLPSKLLHIDLFSGCGGFSVGFEQAGFSTGVALDIHPPSLDTLRANHPNTAAILGDIRKVKSSVISELMPAKYSFCVITAGVPCQGFSLANRKRHAQDDRNYLFEEFVRISRGLEPDAVILENVSGLVSTAAGGFKIAIAQAIEDLGYDVHFAVLNSADYGVPQTRRRVFFVGVRSGQRWVFPTPSHGSLVGEPHLSVGQALLGDLPELKSGEGADTYVGPPRNEFQRYLRAESAALTNHQAPNHPPATIERIKRTKPGEPMYKAFKQRIRLDQEAPSPTQICGGIRPQFQFGHPTQARGLSIRERARLQSFPDSYFFTGGITQGRVQTGNAVPPLLARALANQLKELHEGQQLDGVAGERISKGLFC